MHELPFVKSIFETVSKKALENDAKRIISVRLEIGVLREFIPEYVDKYWKYITKDTIADKSVIEVKMIKATAKCDECGEIYEIDENDLEDACCPKCGCETGTLLTGREIRILGIEIE